MWLAGQLRQLQACRSRHLFFPPSGGALLAGLRLVSSGELSGGGSAHFMVDYLVGSCGLSAAEALRVSLNLAHLKSPEKPDAVVRLLREEGLEVADIRCVVLKVPRVLLAGAEKTLRPKIGALHCAGFSGQEVAQILSANPNIVFFRDVPRRVAFWKKALGTNQNLLKTLKRDPRLLCYSLENRVGPGLCLLRDLGIPQDRLAALIVRRPRLVSGKPERIRSLFEWVRSLGISPDSRRFVEALASLDNLSRATFDAKVELLRSFGWTQQELLSAIHRFPVILRYSEKKIQAMMEFLLKVAGCDPSYVARHPTLVGYSMEKRLMPRFFVLQSLRTKGISAGGNCLLSAMLVTEESFVERYILRHGAEAPELLQAYRDLCGRKGKEASAAGE